MGTLTNRDTCQAKTGTLTNWETCVAFAVCEKEANGDLRITGAPGGQYPIFGHLSQAQDFLSMNRLDGDWQVVPILLILPHVPV